jgi:Tfp pilus assembly protein PilN
MIEINLLPGAKKSKRSGGGGPSINFAAIGAAISSKIKDKYLAAAVLTGAAVLGAIVFLFLAQQRRESVLREAEQKAVADSARYAVVLQDRARAQARRDSALIQLNIIKAIDEDRYIWPHVLEEVSRALPIYTWLMSLNFTGTAQGLSPAASVVKLPPPDTGRVRRRRVEPVIPRDTVHIAMVGRTVDLQAFTRFMRSLEDSPFFQSVQLMRSEIAVEGGKDIHQFNINVTYSRPDTLLLRRVPFTVNQR